MKLTLIHRYVCAPPDSTGEPCRPGRYVRPDIVYLTRVRAGWQVIKPGGVYRASEIDTPDSVNEDYYYPPGTPSTVAGPVQLPRPRSSCPATTSATLASHTLTSTFDPNPRGGPGHQPGLTITGLSAGRLSTDTVCFTLTLAGPPRPDSAYSIFVGTVQQEGAADRYDLEIDGLGQPHTLLAGRGAISHPAIRPYLPHAFLEGTRLQIVATDPFFATNSKFLLQAGTQSTQSNEPLLRRPIDAGDVAPLRGCLTFPTGALNTRGLCGSVPGP